MEKGIITMLDHRENFDKGIEALRELGIETIWENKIIRSSRDPKVVIEQVKGYDYVFAGGEIWNKEVFDACPTVKMIVRLGVGYDGINLADASAAGVPVTYMPGVNAKSVAEHAIALMREGDLSIGEIALQSGYSDIYYFSRVFKSIHGTAPSAFADQIRKNGSRTH